MGLEQLSFPADRRYTLEHIWLRQQGTEWVLGVSDFAQDQLGEVQFVELPRLGEYFESGAGFGSIESVKSINTLYMPVSGKITAVNTELEDNPALVNADCYGAGWLARIEPEADGVGATLDAEAYRAILAG